MIERKGGGDVDLSQFWCETATGWTPLSTSCWVLPGGGRGRALSRFLWSPLCTKCLPISHKNGKSLFLHHFPPPPSCFPYSQNFPSPDREVRYGRILKRGHRRIIVYAPPRQCGFLPPICDCWSLLSWMVSWVDFDHPHMRAPRNVRTQTLLFSHHAWKPMTYIDHHCHRMEEQFLGQAAGHNRTKTSIEAPKWPTWGAA